MANEVNDSALDAAAEEVAVEEEAVETVEEETVETADEVVEEDEDTARVNAEVEHKESSRLGRRLSAMEERMDAFLNQAERLVTPRDEIVEEIDPDMPVTLKEVEAYINRKEETKRTGRVNYESAYVRSVAKLSDGEDGEFADKVMDEMEANFNTEYSIDGGRDAEVNWLKASNAVLRQGSQKKNPLKGKKPKGALGVGGADVVTTREFQIPELDDAAKHLLANSNLTDEQVERALGSKKLYSSGERNAKNV